MKKYFVDTNLFIRYLTNDDPEKAEKVGELLKQAEQGTVKLITAEIVIAEIVWVLESFYELDKTRISEMLEAILSTPGLEVLNKKPVEKAIEYYAQNNIDFVDAYIVALMNKLNISGIYSFNKKHLKKMESIQRLEP